jgi:lipid-A-disaccharide synthase
MKQESPTAWPVFYLVAGEASGDRHAADLVRELRRVYPDCRVLGVGGKQLKAAGQEQLFDLAMHAVVGLAEVLRNYFKFRGFFGRILNDIQNQRPDVLVLVDFPGFNLRLAVAAKRRFPRMRQIYYISPQVWAWKAGRAKTMARVLDLLLVIFPFEERWFQRRAPQLKTTWVGHPLLDRWKQEEAPTTDEGGDGRYRIALLPGSRKREIKRHLPLLLKTAERLARYKPSCTFRLLTPDQETTQMVEGIIVQEKAGWLQCEVMSGYQLTHLSRCQLAFVASGTATLECCLAGVPMFVIYQVNPITYWAGRLVVKLPFLAMVNLLAGRKIVPEFLQSDASPPRLFAAAKEVLDEPAWGESMRVNLAEVAGKLGEPGANRRAAEAIRELLGAGA